MRKEYEYNAYRHGGGGEKSYIGKRLAKRLGMDFIDIDDCFEQTHGKGIQEILDEGGRRGIS